MNSIGHRVTRTLYNPQYNDPLLGLRGAAFLVVALVAMTAWRWDWNTATDYLLVVTLPPLFAIGAVMLTEAWNRTGPAPRGP